MLEEVKEIRVESNLEIPDSNLYRADRNDKPYFERIKKAKYKSIIVPFSIFRHRTLLYRAKNDTKKKKEHTIRLDLTKRRYLMLSKANRLAYENQNANLCYAGCKL